MCVLIPKKKKKKKSMCVKLLYIDLNLSLYPHILQEFVFVE